MIPPAPVRTVTTRGDIAIYLSVMLMLALISFAILFTSIASRQSHVAIDIVDAERAFYAANAALEEGLYVVSRQFAEQMSVNPDGGQRTYPGGQTETYEYQPLEYSTGAVADFAACATRDAAGVTALRAAGTFAQETRRLAVGVPTCELPSEP